MGLGKMESIQYIFNVIYYLFLSVQQIGEFSDWNIVNNNNPNLSSENVVCEDPPPSPRGGNTVKHVSIYLQLRF